MISYETTKTEKRIAALLALSIIAVLIFAAIIEIKP